MNALILLILLGLVLWLWQAALQARDQARAASMRACRQAGVQLLDDTVALERIWLRRDRDGRLCWERRYLFEFTDTGTNRSCGSVVMLGQRVEVVHMEGGDLIVP